MLLVKPLRRPAQAGTYRASSGNSTPQIQEWGRKDRDEKAKMATLLKLNFENPVKIPDGNASYLNLQIPLFHLFHGIIGGPGGKSHVRE
jgi:hypothetical protein